MPEKNEIPELDLCVVKQLIDVGTRSGFKSSEFWTLIGGIVASITIALNWLPEGHILIQALVVGIPAVAGAVWAYFRQKTKKIAIEKGEKIAENKFKELTEELKKS